MIEFDTQIIPTARAMSSFFFGRVQLSKCAKNFTLPEVGQAAEGRGEIALKFYIESTLTNMGRCNEMRKNVLEQAGTSLLKPYVDVLTRLKGTDDITALAYCATMDDFSRFVRQYDPSR